MLGCQGLVTPSLIGCGCKGFCGVEGYRVLGVGSERDMIDLLIICFCARGLEVNEFVLDVVRRGAAGRTQRAAH